MSLAEEVNGLAALMTARFPEAVVHCYQEPAIPAAGEFVVVFKQETRSNETRSHTQVERQYTITCYSGNTEEAILRMEALGRYLMNEQMGIRGAGDSGLIRTESFTFQAPEKQDSGLQKCSGNLRVLSREAVAMIQYEKIGKVETRMTTI